MLRISVENIKLAYCVDFHWSIHLKNPEGLKVIVCCHLSVVLVSEQEQCSRLKLEYFLMRPLVLHFLACLIRDIF